MIAAFTEMLALHADMRRTLARAQLQRLERQEILGGELEWVRYERETMHAAVNQARAVRGLPAAPISVIEQAENQATGHSDYTKKFALYCAKIVLKGTM